MSLGVLVDRAIIRVIRAGGGVMLSQPRPDIVALRK